MFAWTRLFRVDDPIAGVCVVERLARPSTNAATTLDTVNSVAVEYHCQ